MEPDKQSQVSTVDPTDLQLRLIDVSMAPHAHSTQ